MRETEERLQETEERLKVTEELRVVDVGQRAEADDRQQATEKKLQLTKDSRLRTCEEMLQIASNRLGLSMAKLEGKVKELGSVIHTTAQLVGSIVKALTPLQNITIRKFLERFRSRVRSFLVEQGCPQSSLAPDWNDLVLYVVANCKWMQVLEKHGVTVD